MSTSSNNFSHHDLRWGWTARISRCRPHHAKGSIAGSIVGSHQNRALVDVVGTDYRLFADYTNAGDGNAYFVVAAGERGLGVAAAGDPLYTAVVNCAAETAPFAWRHILKLYLPLVASAPPRTLVCAPGPMPKNTPALWGFSDPVVARFSKQERDDLTAVAQVAGASLLEICERAWAETGRSGRVVALDPVDYPELQDWED